MEKKIQQQKRYYDESHKVPHVVTGFRVDDCIYSTNCSFYNSSS